LGNEVGGVGSEKATQEKAKTNATKNFMELWTEKESNEKGCDSSSKLISP
jgi:hypothetical protein